MDMVGGVAGVKLGLALSLVIALSAGASLAQQQPAPAPIEQAAPAPAPVAVEVAPVPVPVPEPAPAQFPPATPAQQSIDIEANDGAANTAPVPLTTQQASPEHTDDTLPHDLSPWGMFMGADYVVKGVMIGLLLASIATWTVWLAKTLELIGAKARIRRALKALQSATSLAEAGRALDGKRGAGATLVLAAQQEVARAEKVIDFAPSAGLKERVSSRLHRIEAAAGRRLTKGTGVLATIGSVSPFVGLFGTVWGIMNAFIGISQAQSSSLAVVAPGIAEALLATAMGLVAAIPAVVFYNAFARSITGYRQLLTDASAAIERLISSDLDHRYVARNHPGALQTLAAE
ncbi:tonB-system energizer ExbB [Devosia submarina]|uniref:tonB-system energizer ExbB n=1 Tax=Devosia submarina TaxID=1173082 RepID=UPI001FE69F77|nr:tonB-system energizer ExbB [Devosia submarina]